jgi:hypothetical protein
MVMVIAGRRFGKTILAVIEIVKRAIEIEGSRIWYLAPTKDQAYRIAWRLMLYPRVDKKGNKYEPYLPTDMISKRREDQHYVELINGSLIEFLGCQDEIFLLGAGLHFVVLDEFPTIDWSIWSDTVRPMLADYNGDALFIATVPDPKVHNISMEYLEMYEKILYDPQVNEAAFNFSSFENPYIDKNKIKKDILELERKGRGNDANRLYFGKYTREYGRIFPKFSREKHVVVPFEIPKDWMRIMGVDPHPQKPTDALWAAIDKRGHFWFYREKEFMARDRSMTIMEAGQDILKIENDAKEKIMARVIDPRSSKVEYNIVGAKSIKDQLRDCGLHFRDASDNFETFFQTMTDKLVDEPEPSIHFFESCPNLIRQMENATWDSWASRRARDERGVKNRPKKFDDDFRQIAMFILNSNIRPIDREAINAFRKELEMKWEEGRIL